MSLSSEPARRSAAFDLARGIGIFWMLMLHHAAFYNYYAPARLGLSSPLEVLDSFCYAWTVFCPWGEQFFIVLAMVNLARGSDSEFRAKTLVRMKRLGLLILLCLGAQFAAWGEDWTEATSFSPVIAWSVLLGVATLVRHWSGLRGCIAFAVGMSALVVLGLVTSPGVGLSYGDSLQKAISQWLGFYWDYNARLEYFVLPSTAGLLVAAVHRSSRRMTWLGVLLGSLCLLPWLWGGSYVWPSRAGIFSNEYSVARTWDGALFLGGLSAIIVSALFELDRRGFSRQVPLLSWLGRHSLLVYLLHGVLQSRFTFPVHALAARTEGFPVQLTDPVILGSMAVTIAVAWLLTRARAAMRVDAHT